MPLRRVFSNKDYIVFNLHFCKRLSNQGTLPTWHILEESMLYWFAANTGSNWYVFHKLLHMEEQQETTEKTESETGRIWLCIWSHH